MWPWIRNPQNRRTNPCRRGTPMSMSLNAAFRSIVTFDDGDYELFDANLLELAHLAWQANSSADISQTLLDALELEAYDA